MGEKKKSNKPLKQQNVKQKKDKIVKSKQKRSFPHKKKNIFTLITIVGIVFFLISINFCNKYQKNNVKSESSSIISTHTDDNLFQSILAMIENSMNVDLYFAANELSRIEKNSSRSLYARFQSFYAVDDFDNALICLQMV